MSTAFDAVLGFDDAATPFNGATIVLGSLYTRSKSRTRGTITRTVSLSGTTGNFDDPTAFDGSLVAFDATGPSQSLIIRAKSRSRGTLVPTTFYWPTVTEVGMDDAIGFDDPVAFGRERPRAITRGKSRVSIKPAPDFDSAAVGFDTALIDFDGIDVRAFVVTAAPIIRLRGSSRARGAIRTSGASVGNRPLTVKTSGQKAEPQKRRPGPLSTVRKLIRRH